MLFTLPPLYPRRHPIVFSIDLHHSLPSSSISNVYENMKRKKETNLHRRQRRPQAYQVVRQKSACGNCFLTSSKRYHPRVQ